MNNQNFIKIISEKTKIKPKKIQNILRYFNTIVAQTLKYGDKITIANFGTLYRLDLGPRKIIDFKNKSKTIELPPQSTVRFKPSISFKTDTKTAKKLNFQGEKTMPPNENNLDVPREKEKKQSTKPIYVSYIDLSQKKINQEVLQLIPEQMARKYQIAPVDIEDNKLILAMIDPEDQEALEFVKKKTGFLVEPRICTLNDLNSALSQYSLISSEVNELVKEEKTTSKKEKKSKMPQAEEIAEGSPASKIVSSLIKKAVRESASDIHIEPQEEEVFVRFRIDGVLKNVIKLPKEIHSSIVSRIKILSDLKIDETRLPQDGRFRTTVDQNEIDFRVSILPNVNGEKIVLRILDKTKGLMTLEELGLRGKSFEILNENIKKSHGMILVTGPTGSGKTTSLYAMILKIMNEKINIVTLEDPVEYKIKGINQSQIKPEIDFTFANGLRAIVRQDPDVIMIGEIRDYETADMAIHAALTGHVVLSTIHTNDAAGTIPRLIDIKIEPFLIASTLNTIIAQRLARKICEKCKEKAQIPDEEMDYIKKIMTGVKEAEGKKFVFYQGKGCDICGGTGYKGRIGIFEIMPITPEIKKLITAKASNQEILEEAVKEGMVLLKQDGILKAIDGLTSIEEVWRVTKD